MNAPQQLLEIDKAALISYVLGKCMLSQAGVLVFEAKVSIDPKLKILHKPLSQKLTKLNRSFYEMYSGVADKLNDKQKEHLEEAIMGLIDNLWDQAK